MYSVSFPLIFLNGWAMPNTVLASLVSKFEPIKFRVINLSDLPLPESGHFTLNDLIKSIHLLIPDQRFVLAGWSFGGMLACAYAGLFPERVKALVTLATNPSFIQRPDWPTGMPENVFSDFVTGFKKNPDKTLQQFAILCSMGGKHSRQLSKRLQKALKSCSYNPAQLLPLLQILGTADIRSLLADVQCPVTHFHGEQDELVPSGVAEMMKKRYSNHKSVLSEGGHCFFLDNAAQVVAVLKQYCLQGGETDGYCKCP